MWRGREGGAEPRQISRDLIEWRGRLEGPDGLLLLLFLMFLCNVNVSLVMALINTLILNYSIFVELVV